MRKSIIQRSWILLLFMAAAPVASVQAQLSNLDVRLYGGVVSPVGTFADYFDFGPSVRLSIVRPVGDRAGLILDLGFDRLGREQYTYVPYTNLWHYQLGAEINVVDQMAGVLSLRPYARVGATTFRSEYFTVIGRVKDSQNLPPRFSHTYLSGAGGLRLVIEPGDGITWFLNGEFGWSPVAEADAEVLRTVSLEPLDRFSAATTRAVTAGVSFRVK
jgi:hypothetical protein